MTKVSQKLKSVLEEFNYIFPTSNFTVEEEKENSLNYLDVTLKRMQKHINLSIFSKPTTTDYIIPIDSGRPVDQKFATIRSFSSGICSYPTEKTEKEKKIRTDKSILHNNWYNTVYHKYYSDMMTKNKEKEEENHGDNNQERMVCFYILLQRSKIYHQII